MAEAGKTEGAKGAKADADRFADVAALSFEAALAELEGIVQRLEGGNVPLEESIAIYERGEALRRRCDTLLKAAEARVEMITRDADGRPSGVSPLDPAG